MNKKIDLIVANPAGNITIMVLSPITLNDYKEVSDKLLEMDFGDYCSWANSVKGEQVMFALPHKQNKPPAMNMCGLEFCGNASRAFAYYRVTMCNDGKLLKYCNKIQTSVQVSGCTHPITALIDVIGKDSQIQMPLPLSIVEVAGYKLVNFEGISHLIVTGISATTDNFEKLKVKAYNLYPNMEAFGIMFLDTFSREIITPVVYVRDVDTTYFEGSCASGSAAVSCVKAIDELPPSGEFSYTLEQPAGTLCTQITKENNEITSVKLSGHIELSDKITVEI